MSTILIDHQPNQQELFDLTQEYLDYIKLVADIKTGILYGGCRLHYDAEQLLLSQGSKQDNIWGGGVDLINKIIDCSAVANIRPRINTSDEILDPVKRQKFIQIVKKYFPSFNGQ